MTLSSVYSFWKHVTNLERSETKRYLEMLYVLKMRALIEKVPKAKDSDEVEQDGAAPQPKHFF